MTSERRIYVGSLPKPIPLQVGLQVLCRIRAQAAARGDLRPNAGQLGPIFHALAKQKECQIIEGYLMQDHVHMCIAIPPKHPVVSVIGFLKGKSAIAVARLSGNERNFTRALVGPWVRCFHGRI